jgi:hypothetical protein
MPHLTAAADPSVWPALVAGLRQTPPFRYVDALTGFGADGLSLGGTVRLAGPGRYSPGQPEMLLVEALAQLSGVLLQTRLQSRLGGVLAAIETARWHAAPDPQAEAALAVRVIQESFPIFTLAGTVHQRGALILSAEFSTRSNAGDTP